MPTPYAKRDFPRSDFVVEFQPHTIPLIHLPDELIGEQDTPMYPADEVLDNVSAVGGWDIGSQTPFRWGRYWNSLNS